MDRRSFLRGLGMVVAGVAIDQAIPLGRVWSFPSKIVVAPNALIGAAPLTVEHLRKMQAYLKECFRDVELAPDTIYIHPAQREAYLELVRPAPYAAHLDQLRFESLEREIWGDFRITGITVPQGE